MKKQALFPVEGQGGMYPDSHRPVLRERHRNPDTIGLTLGPQGDYLSGGLTSCPEDIDFGHHAHHSALR